MPNELVVHGEHDMSERYVEISQVLLTKFDRTFPRCKIKLKIVNFAKLSHVP